MQVDHNLSYYDARDVGVRVVETDAILPVRTEDVEPIEIGETTLGQSGNLMNEDGFEEIADPKRHEKERLALQLEETDSQNRPEPNGDKSSPQAQDLEAASFELEPPGNGLKTNKASTIIGRSEPGSFLEQAKQLKEQMQTTKSFSATSCSGDFEKSKAKSKPISPQPHPTSLSKHSSSPPEMPMLRFLGTSGDFQSFARENQTWSNHDAQVSELKKQAHAADSQVASLQSQVQALTQTLLEKDKIMNEGAKYTAKFYEMRDQCIKQEDRLRTAQAHLFQLQKERNQLYEQKKSYINFEGFLTMVSLVWLLSR